MRSLNATIAVVALFVGASVATCSDPSSDPGKPKYIETESSADMSSLRRDLDETKKAVADLLEKSRRMEAVIKAIESRLDAIEARLGIARKDRSSLKTTDRAEKGSCQIRVVNLQSVRIAVTVGGTSKFIPPGETSVFRDVECGSVSYSVHSPRYRDACTKTAFLSSGQSLTVRVESDKE